MRFVLQWERYMRCDGSADPTIAGEINTYINLEKEDNSNNTIDAQLPKCRHTRVVSEPEVQGALQYFNMLYILQK